ncbi:MULTISPECIES: lasso RiPP family leader peptide-containing protein [unclassified Plantactinospora]|uniref:lasso RiPP family leader peptide-containing protein n=1 Tax=unclassified Plantactinospora TaxID=2631981 RepID=UPI00131F0005|nr:MULTISPECIES: lasso RiPP family leader peptide-containing protein [unclassified Plantactinospora]
MNLIRDDSAGHPHDDPADYQAPTVRRLGTLAELTRGGTVGPDDGLGGAGDEGSV